MLALAVGFVTCAAAAGVASAAIDPFYENLLRKGTDAFNQRSYAEASRLLRLACFGMLEEPELLADALSRLALAQAAAGDREGFAETFTRLHEVEDRFGAWSSAKIPADLRTALLRQARRLLPAAVVEAIPLAGSRSVADADPTPPLTPDQRREVERRVARDPQELRGRLLLARDDLAGGRIDGALRGAEQVLALAPGNAEALQVRGLAFAAREKWAEAVNDLVASGRAARDPASAVALLRGLLALERREEAATILAGLAPAVRADPAVAALAAQITPAPKQ